ncbi:MAG: MFS transporter [Candidatus Thermoplasmatota archaeon]|jgi:MFS family permease|nr:MFS transporter [Candidatus Thermoplasmatota archaeon]
MQPWKRIALPVSGFITTSIVFSVLASVTFYAPSILPNLNSKLSLDSFISIITIVYFAGMPFGKILGRVMKFHRNASFWTLVMLLVIIFTIFITPYVHSLALFIAIRFIQGTASFLMEIFSISYSFLFKERERSLASAVSISGIPAGVTFGSILALNLNCHETFIIIPILGLVSLIPFIYLLNFKGYSFRSESYTTYNFRFTWIYGFLWMTIAGFNLTLAVIIPLYLEKFSPEITRTAMSIFGYWGALATILGGTIAYAIYSKLRSALSLILVGISGYAISIPGFILLYLHPGNVLILIGILLIMTEALAISPIYTTPIDVYGRERVGNGVWEFSLIGSTGHIIAPLMLLPMGLAFGFNTVFLFLIIFPLYGIVAMFFIYGYIRDNDIKKSGIDV